MMDRYTRLLDAAALSKDEAHADAAVAKLLAHLKASGRIKMLPSILQELKKIAGRRKLLAPTLEVASEKEKDAALSAAKAEGIEVPEARVNPSLVSGWRASANGQLIDKSGKRALIDIYRKVTS